MNVNDLLAHEEAQLSFFALMSTDARRELAGLLRPATLPAGALLFREGEPGDSLCILVEGEVDIIKALNTEDERLIRVQGPGTFLGEMSLFSLEGLRTASVRTRTPVQLLKMSLADFDELLRRRPSLAYEVVRVLAQRLRESDNTTIRDLREKNLQLARAFEELKAAQAQLIEKERLEQELRVARIIQQSLLPRELPVVPGWEFSAAYRPARAVGGDFYDFVSTADGKLAIVIGDVTDKGVPAALVMAMTRTLLRAASESLTRPAEVLARVNNLLQAEIPPRMFVTCLFALLDPQTGRLVIANAGHDLPFWRRTRLVQGHLSPLDSGFVQEVRATGMPLGLLPDMVYEETEIHLRPGDRLLLYSDGLAEAHNPAGQMFGFPRVQALLQSYDDEIDLISYTLEALGSFAGPGWEQEDDVTLVSVLFQTPGRATVQETGRNWSVFAECASPEARQAAGQPSPGFSAARQIVEET